MTSQRTLETMRKLISANHILHKHGAVDGFGFIGVRHPENPSTFLLSGYGAPALVESASDLIEYQVANSEPVDARAGKGYLERYIVGEVLRRFPDVNAVVHSHATEVLPYCCSSVPLQPVFHMGGFLGRRVPVWDIRECYQDEQDHRQDMLVSNAELGSRLAGAFLDEPSGSAGTPDHNVVLQARHGFTTHGPDIETAVFQALYTGTNARIQTEAALLQATTAARTADGVSSSAGTIHPFSSRNTLDCEKMNSATHDKAWKLWLKEVRIDPLYTNALDVDL